MAFVKQPGNDDSPDRQPRREHFCHKCTDSFKTMEELNEHYKKSHCMSKSFYCAMCLLVYPEHQQFEAHLSTCPGRTYKCNFVSCGETFSELGLLEAHATSHRTGPVLSEGEPSGSRPRGVKGRKPRPPPPSTRGAKLRKLLPKVSVETVPLQINDRDVEKPIENRYEESKPKSPSK